MQGLYSILLLLLSTPLWTQPFHFEIFDTQDGLLSSEITTLFQDSKGYLWVGTVVGLSKYDGYTFTNFTMADGLQPSQIKGIVEDENNDMWIATTLGLSFYDGQQFHRVAFDSLIDESIWVTHLTPNGDLWVGTDARISVLKKENFHTAKQHPTISAFHHFDLIVDVNAINSDAEGNVYFTDFETLLKYDGHTFEKIGKGTLDNEIDDAIMSIFPLTKDTVLVGSRSGHIFKMAKNHKSNFIPYLRDSYDALQMIENEGRLFILDQNGVKIIKDGQQVYNHSLYQSENIKLLSSMIKDREHNFWIGSREGLIKMMPRDFTIHQNIADSIKNGIFSLAENRDGELVIGGNSKRNYIKKADHSLVMVATPPPFPSGEIYDLLLDHQGDLWYVSNWDGIVRYKNEQQLDYFFYQQGIKEGADLFCIFEDNAHQIWVGHTAGVDAIIMDWAADTLVQIRNYLPGLVSVYCMVQDNDGTLWLGTSKGLYFYKNDSFLPYSLYDYPPCIIEMKIDEQQNLWIATQGKGLLQWRITAPYTLEYVNAFNHKNSLASDFLLSLEVNELGDIWLGSYVGISVLKKQENAYHVINYNPQDGLFDKAYQNMALYKDQKNVIWAATSMGLLSFDPANIKTNQVEPAIYLDGVKVFDKDVFFKDKNLILAYNENTLTFSYTAISLKNPSKIKYQYQLEGLTSNWSNNTTQREVTFNNLPDGDYVFKVKACNNDYVWNSEPAQFSFQIRPPFWKTGWFIFSMIALILAASYGFYRYRIFQIRKTERERSRINQLIAELETRALRAQMNPHFIFNCLNAIQECIVTEQIEAAYEYLYKFSRLMRQVLNSSSKSLITVSSEVEILTLYLELEALRFDDKFHYHIEVENEEEIGDILMPSLMVQPFVENAIWHGLMHKKGDCSLHISFTSVDETLVCRVKDNGIGREKAQALKKSRTLTHQSQALQMVKDRLQIIEQQSQRTATLDITDLKDEQQQACGTLVTLTLPDDLFEQ